ncbi:PREDICTED: androgen-dependent TFPI-regulating protein-like [Papilio polytes]|uniref:androgen-dependent TFPI-regulating protein-like n=1 Tax=Papilio polytes TaxID=76194 RepID=UPI0006762AB0|nr:PREDICTED: androgen-dependent TFPI-regulating protein-like [Papilio polytes]XP_013136785.1 PREDICTED: androgen-dependent TFPI-regulating protein-like [Papilio polytes]
MKNIFNMRLTKNYAPYRLFGYATSLALHGGNSIVMFLALRGDIMKDPEIKTFAALQWAYITIWNVVFQLAYPCLGILCDLPTLLEIKEHGLIKQLKTYREIIFASIILPLGVLISLIFWPIYLYDRELVFPAFIDKVLSQGSNHIMHTAILLIVIWEFMFLPKSAPVSHKINLIHTYGCYFSYLVVLFATHHRIGAWPYPFLKLALGTIYFPIIFIGVGITVCLFYLAQWPINKLVWGTKQNVKENKLKR